MPLPSDYISGTITLTAGEVDFTGTGTGWLAADFREGDIILDIAGGGGRVAVVQSITGNDAGTLSKAWDGPTLTGVAYRIRYQWDSSRVSAQTRTMIEKLGNGNLESFSGVTGPGVVVMDGPHSVIVKPESDFINGVAYDVQVDTLPDRAAYDGQSVGFSVLVSDVGDGRSAVYSKASNTVGDWTDPAYVTGPVGDTGPYTELTFGAVTTVPYGTPASVDVVPVDPDTVRLDFSIPAGQNGTGTGDVVGPVSAINDHIAVYDGTTGDLIKDGGKTIAEVLAEIPQPPPSSPQGRLSLVSNTASPESDVTGATTIYYVPNGGQNVPIYDGTKFVAREITGMALPLDATSGHTGYHQAAKNFDLFAVFDGTLKLGSGPSWEAGAVAGSNTARGTGAGSTELEVFAGNLVNKNAITIRFGSGSGDTVSIAARQATYLGSFRPTANGQASDTKAKRLLFNAYNRVVKPLFVFDPAASWTYSAAAFRQLNGNAANQVEFLLGLAGIAVSATHQSLTLNSTTTARTVAQGIGLDSTTALALDQISSVTFVYSTFYAALTSNYDGFPGLGWHRLVPLERGDGADVQTWFGTNSATFRHGLAGQVTM